MTFARAERSGLKRQERDAAIKALRLLKPGNGFKTALYQIDGDVVSVRHPAFAGIVQLHRGDWSYIGLLDLNTGKLHKPKKPRKSTKATG